jgi:hypothetical protein
MLDRPVSWAMTIVDGATRVATELLFIIASKPDSTGLDPRIQRQGRTGRCWIARDDNCRWSHIAWA